MDYSKIATVANAYTNEISGVLYITSGAGVAINYYIPNLINYMPNLNPIISGMHWFVLMSVLGMMYNILTSKKALHPVTGTKCHICESSLLYTGLKCSNLDCNYDIELNTQSIQKNDA